MQQVILKHGAASLLPELLRERSAGRLFLVTGEGAFRSFEERHYAALQAQVATRLYKRSGTIITQGDILEATTAFEESNADAIAALGGGRTIDLAKCIIFQRTGSSRPFFIALPTTAGSGSEATCFAVCYEGLEKRSVEDTALLPDAVLLDPDCLDGLPLLQKAVSGADALAQSVESLWSRRATEASLCFAEEAASALFRHLPGYAAHKNPAENMAVMQAAYLAGKAINISKTTGPHALSYFLTVRYGIPHGQAVSLLLPVFCAYNALMQDHNHTGILDRAMQRIRTMTGAVDFTCAAYVFRDFFKGIGLAVTLAELNLDKLPVIDELLEHVNQERFSNHPVPYDKKLLRQACIALI